MSITWTPWSFPAQGSTAPGSSITVLPTSTAGQYALFVSDHNGYIYTTAGLTYAINVTAQNAGGTSSSDTVTNVVVPYTPPPTQTVTVSMQQQVEDGNIAYLGKYPLVGDGSGILNKITIPASSQIVAFNFLKPGSSNDQCYDPDAVVTLNQGTSTTAAQITAIFGTAEPFYSAAQPIPFLACILKSSLAVPVPTVVDIEITIFPYS